MILGIWTRTTSPPDSETAMSRRNWQRFSGNPSEAAWSTGMFPSPSKGSDVPKQAQSSASPSPFLEKQVNGRVLRWRVDQHSGRAARTQSSWQWWGQHVALRLWPCSASVSRETEEANVQRCGLARAGERQLGQSYCPHPLRAWQDWGWGSGEEGGERQWPRCLGARAKTEGWTLVQDGYCE